MRLLFSIIMMLTIAGCATRGKLAYITPDGERKTACETEYTWAPSVDKYAVEYTLSYCAKQLVNKGHRVIDESLLTLDLSIPSPPNGKLWTFDYATMLHDQNKLSDKEYGYIIAYIDLGLNKSNL